MFIKLCVLANLYSLFMKEGFEKFVKGMIMKLLETSQTISDLAIYIMLWHEKSLFDQF